MHQKKDKKYKLFFYLFLFILLSSINNKYFLEKNYSLLKINEIKINGLSKIEKAELYKEFKKLFLKNIFFVNQESFEEILNKNNLIEYFYVKKNYPNSIQVDIKKTKFLAITNFNKEKYFIGSNGKLIKYNNSQEYEKELPYVFGKIDYPNFIEFKIIIDKSNFKYENIDSFYYFQNKRWDIKTKKKFFN